MRLQWKDGNKPYSQQFDDIFYADEDGLEESRYVFIGQNRLPERFLTTSKFSIGELGFGTGLNFFATWDLFRKSQSENPHLHLHYLSCEKFLLDPDQISQAMNRWPELEYYVSEFFNLYSSDLPQGFHRFHLENGRFTFDLLVGDVWDSLAEVSSKIDAWFLDGFSPRKNPEMWSEELFKRLGELSSTTSTFATYTSAGFVRRNLIGAGFKVEKFEGFGRKRHMLRGKFQRTQSITKIPEKKKAIVLGAGLAGASIASRLSRKNWKVSILEKNSRPASGASNNKTAITLPVLSKEPTHLSQLSLEGWMYLVRNASFFDLEYLQTGILQFPMSSEKKERWLKAIERLQPSVARFVDPTEASSIAGIPLQNDALYLPRGLLVNLPQLCRVQASFYQNVHKISKTSSGTWQALDENGEILDEGDLLILANGYEMNPFVDLSLRKVRGQLAYLKTNPELNRLKTSLCFDGFLTPAIKGCHTLGATYDNEDLTPEVREKDTEELLSKLRSALPYLKNFEIESNWVGFRTSVAGQLPVVGALENGLYLLTAFGSRGSIYAPLCAEALASLITEDPLPMEQKLFEALSPHRLKRKE